MLQFLYDLVNWQYFGILLIIWLVVDLVWVNHWKKLFGRINKLINKPYIFKKDIEPSEPPFYPREFLENIARTKSSSTNSSTTEISPETINTSAIVSRVQIWFSDMGDRVFQKNTPLRSFGSTIAFIFFIFFIFADIVTVMNTLVLMGIVESLSPFFNQIGLAILGGSLLSITAGVWMINETKGKGILIDTEALNVDQKKVNNILSVTIILFAILVLIAFTIDRLILLGYLESSTTMEIILACILYGLLPINSSLAASLLFHPAMAGIVVIAYLVIAFFLSILPSLAFLIDILWRIFYIIFDTIVWLVTSPIIIIPYGVLKLFKVI
jgi:hypothetical protein